MLSLKAVNKTQPDRMSALSRFLMIPCLLLLLVGMMSVIPDATAQVVDRYVKRNCGVTPRVGTSNYPGFKNIISSNKPAAPPGKALIPDGQPVYFFARVFDQQCVPVTDAKVELWHTDPQGRYRFATKAALATPDAVFAGAGRTYTDNVGQFTFFTLYPGPYQYYVTKDDGTKVLIKRAPHFNIRITHGDYPTYDTNVYFLGDTRNSEDHKLKGMSAGSRQRLMMDIAPRQGDWNQGIQTTMDIIIPGKSPWKRF